MGYLSHTRSEALIHSDEAADRMRQQLTKAGALFELTRIGPGVWKLIAASPIPDADTTPDQQRSAIPLHIITRPYIPATPDPETKAEARA